MGRLRRAIERHGLAGTARLAADLAKRRALDTWRFGTEVWFDLRHGVHTRGIVRDPHAGKRGDAYAHAVHYQGVWTSTFRDALTSPAIGDRAQYTFVDLGAGKGKAVLMASTYGFRRVIGVELSPELAAIAERNVARFAARRPSLSPTEIVCADASTYELSPDPLVIYLHNPFDDVILRRVAESLRQSLLVHPRPALVVYHAPVHRHVLDEAGFLQPAQPLPGGLLYRA
jgi:16S rRNA G966 N2-methylase RsmD